MWELVCWMPNIWGTLQCLYNCIELNCVETCRILVGNTLGRLDFLWKFLAKSSEFLGFFSNLIENAETRVYMTLVVV